MDDASFDINVQSHTGASLAVRARGLVKRFGGLEAVAGIDLDVPRGMIFAILGPNGAGKTTLMRMLATLTRPECGNGRGDGPRPPRRARRGARLDCDDRAVRPRSTRT